MITDFFSTSDRMLALARAAMQPRDVMHGNAEDTMHAVVEQVLPQLTDSAASKKKLRGLVREDTTRRLLNKVVNEKEGFRMITPCGEHNKEGCRAATCTTHNPSGAASLAHLLHAHLGDGSVTFATWQRYVSENRAAVQPLFDVLQRHRQQEWEQQHMVYFQQMQATDVALGSGGGGGTKRKHATGAGASGAASTAMVCGGGGHMLDVEAMEYDKTHRLMRDMVLHMEARTTSPPASPRAERPKPVTDMEQWTKLTSAERMQRCTFDLARIPSTQQGTSNIAHLFDKLNTDDACIPDTYAPNFDRNDLFLTNIKDAQRLVALASAVTGELKARKQRGEKVAFDEVQSVKIVMVEYSTPPVDAQAEPVVWAYVTWAIQTELKSGAFLDGLLDGTTRVNDTFLELLDRIARSPSGMVGGLWKQRFSVTVIDDCHWFVSERDMAAFVATVDMYAEQFHCVGGNGARVGLNTLHNHARHRLIYEAGSIQSYQQLWLFTHAKANYEKLCERVHAVVAEVVDTALTFWEKLCALITNLSRSDADVAGELSPLGRLMDTKLIELDAHLEKVKKANERLLQVANHRRVVVQDAFAAAQVREFRDKTPIPRGLTALRAAVVSGEADQHTPFSAVVQAVRRASDIFNVAAHAWFFLGKAVKSVHQQRAAVKAHEPEENVRVLRALVLLGLWVPSSASPALLATPMDTTVPLPLTAPQTLDKDEAKAVLLAHHPDKKHKRARPAAESDAAAVISARALLKRFYATVPFVHGDGGATSTVVDHADDNVVRDR